MSAYAEIVAYTYEAAYHCDACAAARFGRCPCDQRDVHGEDAEGNEVAPVFAGEYAGGESCSDCGAEIG